MLNNVLSFYKNLRFAFKVSFWIFIIIAIWMVSGSITEKPDKNLEKKAKGIDNLTMLASEIKTSEVHKIIIGYGNIDRGKIDVISEVNSHIQTILKKEGTKIQKGEPVILMLGNIRVPSPITGTLDKIDVKQGGIVFAGQTLLFSVISSEKLDVTLQVSANDARFIKKGDEAEIKINDVNYIGEVYFISKISAKNSNAFEIKIKLKPSNEAELFHDESARVKIKTIKKHGYFVPTSAIAINSNDEIIISYVNKEGIVSKAKAEILQTFAEGMWIASDELPDTAIIILRGGDFTKEGDKINYTLEEFKQISE